MKKLIQLFSVLFVASLVLWGCSTTNDETEDSNTNKIHIVTSMFPMYEITKEIVGDRAEVSVMVGPSEDAHHYEPSAKAVASVNEADVFIYSSNEMEFWVESLLSVIENEDLKVIELGEYVSFELLSEEDDHDHQHEEDNHDDDHGHSHGHLDPHFWLNPVTVENELQQIVEVLVATDPEGQQEYEKRAAAFSKELLEIDRAYQDALGGTEHYAFVVQHQAFGHLANQYHLDQVAIGGLTTEVEPNPKKLAEIVKFVNEQQISVIYYQSGEASAVAETIAKETGTEIGVLYDLESLPLEFKDADRPYIEAMRENLEQLKKTIDD